MEYTEQQKQAIRASFLPERSTEEQFNLFMSQCERTGLDPFARQIQCYGQGSYFTIVVTIDGLRSIAARSGQYGGQTPQEWCGTDGKWLEVWIDEKPPQAARCGVYLKGAEHPIYAVQLWSESNGRNPKNNWKTMGVHMLSKCAEALALRKAFPNLMGGLYTVDEMGSQQSSDSVQQASLEPAAKPKPDNKDDSKAENELDQIKQRLVGSDVTPTMVMSYINEHLGAQPAIDGPESMLAWVTKNPGELAAVDLDDVEKWSAEQQAA